MSNKQIPEGAQFTADGSYFKIKGLHLFWYSDRGEWYKAIREFFQLAQEYEITWLDGVDAEAVKRKYIADAASVIGVKL